MLAFAPFSFFIPFFFRLTILMLLWKWKIPNPFFIHLLFAMPGDVVTIRNRFTSVFVVVISLLLSFQPNRLFNIYKARFSPVHVLFTIVFFYCTPAPSDDNKRVSTFNILFFKMML